MRGVDAGTVAVVVERCSRGREERVAVVVEVIGVATVVGAVVAPADRTVTGGAAASVTGGGTGRLGFVRGRVVVVVVVVTAAPDGSTPGLAKLPNANASNVPGAG
jgi:hypothetical protein